MDKENINVNNVQNEENKGSPSKKLEIFNDNEEKKEIKDIEVECPELCVFDDILCDILIDNFYMGFRTHKLNKINEQNLDKPTTCFVPNSFSETVLNIIKRNMLDEDNKDCVDKAYEELISFLTSSSLYSDYKLNSLITTQLINFPTFKEYFDSLSPKEKLCFEEHTKRYIAMYHVKAGYQLTETNRYKSTGKKECCLLATKNWHKGDVIKYCTGILCPISNEELRNLKEQDFSIMFATSLQCNALFLGPGRFMNHDCQPNCEFVSGNKNTVNFRIIRDVNIGEELTVYYSDSYFGINNCDCLCESCEKKQLGGFSRPVEDSTTSESEKENAINHPMSSVLRHRRRAQPLSFRNKSDKNSKSSNSKNNKSCCGNCGRPLKKYLVEEDHEELRCGMCSRHYKIYEQEWPGRDPKNRRLNVNNDDLDDFKELFFTSVYNRQVDERYNCLYDFYNEKNLINTSNNINKDNDKKEKYKYPKISNHRRQRSHSNNSNQEKEIQKSGIDKNREDNNNENNKNDENNSNNENNNYIKESDFDSLTDLISGYDYSYKPFNRKRRLVLDEHLKFLNKSAKKKKFITYDSTPSQLSYDTLTYFGFSDYSLGLENYDNKNHLLFSQISEIVRKYENNEKTAFTYNLLNSPLPVNNKIITNDHHPIYLDPLITPEIIYKTLFDDNYEQRQEKKRSVVVTGVDMEFLRNSYCRKKLKKYLSYKNIEEETELKTTRFGKTDVFQYYGINILLNRLHEIYKNQWKNIQNNDIVVLNNNLITNKYHYNNLHAVKLYQPNEQLDCYSEYGWYKAVIKEIKFDEKNFLNYYIHYENWSTKYDIWVTPKDLRNTHEEIDRTQTSTIGTR